MKRALWMRRTYSHVGLFTPFRHPYAIFDAIQQTNMYSIHAKSDRQMAFTVRTMVWSLFQIAIKCCIFHSIHLHSL